MALKPSSTDEIVNQVKDLENIVLTKAPHMKAKISHEKRRNNWNKKSIFFQLPYWKDLLLRHNLDVMHIEKNICDNILGIIMNIEGKPRILLRCVLILKKWV